MKRSVCVLGVLLVFAGTVFGSKEPGSSVYDRLWGVPQLVDHEDAAVLQSLAITGRLQGDAVYFDSNDGDHEDFVWRRFRIGGKAVLFRDFVAHAEADIDLNKWGSNASYKGLSDSYLGWYPNQQFRTKVGKQSAGFTLDGATSSTKLLTMERSILAENLWFSTEYFTGATGFGRSQEWTYKLGGFSASGDPEFGEFDSGWFALASLGRAVSENIKVRVDYVYNDPDYTGEVGTADLAHVISFVSHMEREQAGLWTDLSFGDGLASQSDLIGLQLMPFWSFTEIWQAVFRYAVVHSTDGSGAELARYPGKNSSSQYETIHDAYIGLNCFLYGHKLKWQSGLEYNYGLNEATTGAAYRGWGASTGIRVSW